MIQEAHVGFGIYGKEGHQAARCADFAFTRFSMVQKMLLVMGHWYYHRLAMLIHYFFYKNLVLGNIMLIFVAWSGFSTQSIFDSMYLTFYNLLFTSMPVLVLSVTDQTWPKDKLLQNPALYRQISRNRLLSVREFVRWCWCAAMHSALLFAGSWIALRHEVILLDGSTADLWCFGATLFHLMVVVVNLKLWLEARYQTVVFIGSVIISIVLYIAFNTIYSLIPIKFDGDILGTYIRLLASPAFWFLNVCVVVATLLPSLLMRLATDLRRVRATATSARTPDVFTTQL